MPNVAQRLANKTSEMGRSAAETPGDLHDTGNAAPFSSHDRCKGGSIAVLVVLVRAKYILPSCPEDQRASLAIRTLSALTCGNFAKVCSSDRRGMIMYRLI